MQHSHSGINSRITKEYRRQRYTERALYRQRYPTDVGSTGVRRNFSTKACVGETQWVPLRDKTVKTSTWTCGQKGIWAELPEPWGTGQGTWLWCGFAIGLLEVALTVPWLTFSGCPALEHLPAQGQHLVSSKCCKRPYKDQSGKGRTATGRQNAWCVHRNCTGRGFLSDVSQSRQSLICPQCCFLKIWTQTLSYRYVTGGWLTAGHWPSGNKSDKILPILISLSEGWKTGWWHTKVRNTPAKDNDLAPIAALTSRNLRAATLRPAALARRSAAGELAASRRGASSRLPATPPWPPGRCRCPRGPPRCPRGPLPGVGAGEPRHGGGRRRRRVRGKRAEAARLRAPLAWK